MEKVEQQTGKRPAQLDAGGEFPAGAEHVWLWFNELCGSRPGPGLLPYTEVQAYFGLHGIVPAAWELEAVKRLDRAWVVYRQNRTDAEPASRPGRTRKRR